MLMWLFCSASGSMRTMDNMALKADLRADLAGGSSPEGATLGLSELLSA